MRGLYNKANAPYLIAGALATLVLLASGTLAVTPYVKFLSSVAAFNVALPVALSLSILSVLVLALSCKIISNNKKIEVEKNKFAEKEQELENKIALGKEAKEAASKEVERLNNRLNELTREKQDLESEIAGLNEEIEWLEDPQEELYDESEGKGGDENKNEELEKNVTKEIENLRAYYDMTSKNVDLHKQNKKHSSENSNIDKDLFDKSLKSEKKHNEHLNNMEETLKNVQERTLLQGNAVPEAANSLEMVEDLSSEHLSKSEEIGENTSANEQFLKPKLPYIYTPIRPPYKELKGASCDSGYTSRCSTPANSYCTF
ncbi:hypothetical protein [Wolbachia endosymbiont (group A) of Anomoia purmunda]|uniref:hypothetical protein n=1 Tax=Wolbachia endosymbiont (group A) of Anomoia purmunda TaxID=2953978 RepID=UPI002231AEC0|nr:hypothetical protein [Wolbachia endosymbiont (group A) of Anomoia purmunda]